jgi:hypothetical protein
VLHPFFTTYGTKGGVELQIQRFVVADCPAEPISADVVCLLRRPGLNLGARGLVWAYLHQHLAEVLPLEQTNEGCRGILYPVDDRFPVTYASIGEPGRHL